MAQKRRSGAIPTGGFDFNALRLSQDYEQTAGVEKLLTTVPVRKPNKTEFVRVHPEMHFDTMLLDLKEDRESYLVSPSLLADVSGLAVPVSLKLAINRASVLFLWPLRLPGEDGRSNVWHESAWEAADLAVNRWVSMRANMSLGAYDIYQGAETLSEPQWPGKSAGGHPERGLSRSLHQRRRASGPEAAAGPGMMTGG